MIGNPALPDTLTNKTSEGYFSSLFTALLTLILTIGTLVFFFWFIWGAITWITSGGDKSKAEAARSRVTTALVGIVLLMTTWGILNLIRGIFGINLLSFDFASFYIR